MSRIGKNPVAFESGVQVSINAQNEITVKGAKASQQVKMRPEIKAKVEGNKVVLTRSDDSQNSKALHGLYRALVQNAVIGVTQGFTKILNLNGVGYRAAVKGKVLELNLGFSHPINFEIPAGITIAVEKNTAISVTGPSKEQVGAVAAKIRGFRPPEPYLGKGVKYSDETIRRKAGKAAGK
jgi:large subunit ribosomal protein L6